MKIPRFFSAACALWLGLLVAQSQVLGGTSVVADSVADWNPGVQGANGWYYGFYNNTADFDNIYNPYDPFDFNTNNPFWSFTGGAWMLGPGNPPWDMIGQVLWHPNGTNNGHLDWVIKRWISSRSGDLSIYFSFAKSGSGGNGTTLRILHNGFEVFTHTIAGSDTIGITSVIVLPGVTVGDFIEFALDPLGTDGEFHDGADSSILRATIFAGQPAADSVTDWAPGIQGSNGWYYGFYDQTADGGGPYDPATDFNTTDPNWTFTGDSWVLGPGNPPWDLIGQSVWHPNGTNNGHLDWVIKRWVSSLTGNLAIYISFAKSSSGGNGTTLRVLHNGAEKFRHTVAGNNFVGITTQVVVPAVKTGDLIEFALDPLGTDGAFQDATDWSRLRATIFAGPPTTINWFTLDGGGGTSSNSTFTVRGSIGQHDAGRLTNGTTALNGGFWGVVAVQTSGAPLLSIAYTTTNTVAVFWPSPSTGWMLQQNTNDISSVNWSNAPGSIDDDGTNKTLIVNPPTGNRFYRLFKP